MGASLRIGALVACAILTAPSLARADAASDAKDLFERGREARKAGDCNAAATLFRKANQIYPQGLGSLRNLAECEEQLGHFASARRAWLELKRGLVTTKADEKYEGWDKDATEAAARLKPKVALITVDITVKTPDYEGPASDRSGVELLMNGEKIAPSLFGTELDKDPGKYVVRVQAPDATPVEETVSVGAGDAKRVAIRIVRTPKPAGPTREEIERAESARTRRTYGWIAVGVGGLSLGGSLATFILRGSARSELEEKCPGVDVEKGPCPTAAKDAIDQGKTMSVLSPVFLAVGVVGVGLGVTLLATAPSSNTASNGSRLVVTGGLGRVDATWSF